MAAPETIIGTVKSWGEQKGYGFISSEQVEGDVFFGRAQLNDELRIACRDGFFTLRDRSVSFGISQEGGKQVATELQLVATEGEQIVGTVKSYNPTKGFGFLSSGAIEGTDIFFSKREIPPQLQGADLKGYVATFEAGYSEEGKIQAQKMKLKPMDSTPKGMGKGAVVMGRAAPPPPHVQAQQAQFHQQQQMQDYHMQQAQYHQQMAMMAQAPPPMKGRHVPPPMKGAPAMKGQAPMKGAGKGAEQGQAMAGVVKSFNAEKGFGFISASGLQQDVYFKPDEGVLVEQGSQVQFTLHYTPDGKPQGRGVTAGLAEGQTVVGTVRSFNQKNGFGFIAVPDFAADVYFKGDLVPAELEGDIVGQHVEFSVIYTPDGKPQTKDAKFLEQQPAGYVPPQLQLAKRPTPINHGGGAWEAPAPKRPRMEEPVYAKGGGSGTQYAAGYGKGGGKAKGQSGGCANGSKGGNGAGGEAWGVVKSYNPVKGFGFVSSEAAQADFFFGRKDLPAGYGDREDMPGKQCSFQMATSDQGKPQAQHIKFV